MLIVTSLIMGCTDDSSLSIESTDVGVLSDSLLTQKRLIDAVIMGETSSGPDVTEVEPGSIAQFGQIIDAADSSALAEFFQSYSSPICDSQRCLFLTAARPDVTIALMGAFNGWSSPGIVMTPVPFHPDVLYAEIKTEFESVLEYKFQYDGEWAMDPRNPYVAFYEAGVNSAVYRKGLSRIARVPEVHCNALNNDRSLWVYLPKAYFEDKSARFPVLYLQDGDDVFRHPNHEHGSWQVDKSATALIESGVVPPLIIVGISTQDRMNEYVYAPITIYENPQNPKLEPYIDCLLETILPRINQGFRTLSGREHTAIAGSSLGGLSALYTAWTRSGYFSKVASFSGSFWVGEMGTLDWHEQSMREIISANIEQNVPSDLRIYLDSGNMQGSEALYEADGWSVTDWTRNTLVSMGWDNRSEWDTDGDLASPPENLPSSTPVDQVPHLPWSEAVPEDYLSLQEYLGVEYNVLSLVGHGHGHNKVAWKQRFGTMLTYLFWKSP